MFSMYSEQKEININQRDTQHYQLFSKGERLSICWTALETGIVNCEHHLEVKRIKSDSSSHPILMKIANVIVRLTTKRLMLLFGLDSSKHGMTA